MGSAKTTLVITLVGLMLLPFIAQASSWHSVTDYSFATNPTGQWSYGRKWSATTDSMNLLNVRWGTSGWYLGNVGHGGPSIQSGPIVWPKNNTNGLPVIRWTCPESGSYDLNVKFKIIDGRGGDIYTYAVLNGVQLHTDRLLGYQDSTMYSFSNRWLQQGDHLDFVTSWGGSVYYETGWTEIDATITSLPESFLETYDYNGFAVFARYWQAENCGLCGGADFDGDQDVDLTDLLGFTSNWLDEDTISDHVFECWIETVWDYDTPGSDDDGYDFEIGVDTDDTVQLVEFVTPANQTYQIGSFEIEEDYYEWCYKIESQTLQDLSAFGDGIYTLRIYYDDGTTDETTVLFGVPGSSDPVPQPTQEPVIISFNHNATLNSPVNCQWQQCTNAAAEAVSVCFEKVDDGSQTGYLLAKSVSALDDPVSLIPGEYEVWLNYEVWYESVNCDGILVWAGKYSECDYRITVE